jgi:hypothetical protein
MFIDGRRNTKTNWVTLNAECHNFFFATPNPRIRTKCVQTHQPKSNVQNVRVGPSNQADLKRGRRKAKRGHGTGTFSTAFNPKFPGGCDVGPTCQTEIA